MIKTDIIIIGAGPVGLFTIFEAGLMNLRCHVVDAAPQVGGQLTEIYPKKPIYDIPGFPSVLAKDLVDNLMEQAAPFKPGFTLAETAIKFEKKDSLFEVTTAEGTVHQAPVIIIAGGLGSFEPRKPLHISNLSNYENKGILYAIKEPDVYLEKQIVISGGGDSALDWAIYFAQNQKRKISVVHRSSLFRAHKDSVSKLYELEKEGKIDIYTDSEVVDLKGEDKLETVVIKRKDGKEIEVDVDFWFPLFGLVPSLKFLSDWGLDIEKNSIKVDNTLDYQTNVSGVFAVGDINTYEGKLKLILCGFHEATLAVQSAYKIVYPDKKKSMRYTTVQGIQGF